MSYLNHSSIRNSSLVLAAAMVCAALFWTRGVPASTPDVMVPPASMTLSVPSQSPQTAVLAGGCFWGLELVFAHVDGVLNVVSGYAGGSAETAHYRMVASGNTKHAEAVRITYDPEQVHYTDLLRVYFSVAHDPTQVNQQYPDVGTQYRSEIFATNAAQARLAQAYIRQIEKADVFEKPIATEISRLKGDFYPAETYHQNYAAKNPQSRYIRMYDLPKLKAFKHKFAQLYRTRPARLIAADASDQNPKKSG